MIKIRDNSKKFNKQLKELESKSIRIGATTDRDSELLTIHEFGTSKVPARISN